MPVTATPTSAPSRARTPSAIACATGSLTAPCAASRPGRHVELRALDVVVVGDDAADHPGRAAGDVGQARRARGPPCTTRRRAIRQPRITQRVADDDLERSAVHADDRRLERRRQRVARRDSSARSIALDVRAPRRDVQLDLTGRGEDRRLDRRRPRRERRVDRMRDVLDERLRPAGDLESPAAALDALRRDKVCSRGNTLGVEHRLELARRTRQQDHDFSPVHRSRDPARCPAGLASTVAPRGTAACRRFGSGMRDPAPLEPRANRRQDLRRLPRAAGPSAAATASRVRSSAVGPSPPVVMHDIGAPSACVKHVRGGSSASSPTTDLTRTSMPMSLRRPVRKSEFVSRRCSPSSSEPTARISAVRTGGPSQDPGNDPNRRLQKQIAVDARP